MNPVNVDNSAVNETFIQKSIGQQAWDTATLALRSRAIPDDVASAGLTMAEQVALYTWTIDTSKGPWFVRINRVLRMGNTDSAEFEAVWPLVMAIKSAMDKLPPYVGVAYRAVKESGMTAAQLDGFKKTYQPGKRIALEGFSGASKSQLQMLRGRFKLVIVSKTGRDISALSAKPDQTEVLMPHGAVIQVTEVQRSKQGAIWIWAQEM